MKEEGFLFLGGNEIEENENECCENDSDPPHNEAYKC